MNYSYLLVFAYFPICTVATSNSTLAQVSDMTYFQIHATLQFPLTKLLLVCFIPYLYPVQIMINIWSELNWTFSPIDEETPIKSVLALILLISTCWTVYKHSSSWRVRLHKRDQWSTRITYGWTKEARNGALSRIRVADHKKRWKGWLCLRRLLVYSVVRITAAFKEKPYFSCWMIYWHYRCEFELIAENLPRKKSCITR